MTTGLTATGFQAPTVEEKIDDLNAAFLANIDAGLDLDPDQPLGQVIGTFANDIVTAWDVLATVYNALNPAAAEGNLLVNACALSGTRPQVATYSTVTATLNLNATTTVHAGAVVAVAGQPGNTWVLTADVTSTLASTYTGTFRSNVPGPFVANAGTLTVINTPTVGWNSITNGADAVPGLAADTDTTLRQKREAELAGEGSGDTNAIRAKILEIPGVIQAFVFENVSLSTDATGLPGKAFRAVVWDGASPPVGNTLLIAQAIWGSKPSGIQSFGAISQVIQDSAGNNQTIYFDRAQQLPTYVSCTTTPSVLSGAQTTAVKAAIAAYAANAFNLGVSIIDLPFRASALVASVTTDVPTFAFDFHSTPTNTGNLAVTTLQIATLSTTDILVNGV